MKMKEAMELIQKVSSHIPNADSYERRYDLYNLIQNLCMEYRDMNKKYMERKYQEIAALYR